MNKIQNCFYEKGYASIPNFFAKDLIDTWANDLLWLVEAQLKLLRLAPSKEEDAVKRLSQSLIILWNAKPEAQAWIYDEVNRRPWMFELASNRILLGWVEDLIGTDHIGVHPRLNMIMSMPNHEWQVAYWHQDRFYGPQHHIVSYIPLQDTGAFNGGMMVAPGSHTNGMAPHCSKMSVNDTGNNKWITHPPSLVETFDKVQLDIKAGDLVFFDGYLSHTANINRSDDVRFAITIRYTNLADPFFVERGWQWKDLAEESLQALQNKEPLDVKE